MGSYLFKDCSASRQAENSLVNSRVALLCALLMARIEANTDREHLPVFPSNRGQILGKFCGCRS